MRLLVVVFSILSISVNAFLLDSDRAIEDERTSDIPVKASSKVRSLQIKFTPAPTRKMVAPIPTRRPSRRPTGRATNPPIIRITPSPISKFTSAPGTSKCIIPDMDLYECGDTITVKFNYANHSPLEQPLIDDRIAIYPCYINDYRQAEVWQWACGAPPLTPKTCTRPRSKGDVVFNKRPSYNGADSVWPLTANYNKQRREVNRCFKVVILRNDGQPYSKYCHSTRFTVNENSLPNCSIRLTSPTDGTN